MKCKHCLIIRSAGEKILTEALHIAQKLFDSIDLLSNRELKDPRLRYVNSGMTVKEKNVSYTGDLPKQYHTVIILLDLKQYSLYGYKKFIRFVRRNWRCNILYFSKETQLVNFFHVMGFILKRYLRRSIGYCLYSSLALLKPLKKRAFLNIPSFLRIKV